MKGKKWIAVLLILASVLAIHTAPADEWTEQLAGMMDPYDSAPVTVNWKDLNVPKDTKLPVYSAPFDDAWRGAKGRASVSVKERFTLLGTLQDGAWGLADYKVDDKSRRIGWIRMPEGAVRPSEYGDMYFNRMLLKVTKTVTLTDDPQNGSRKIRSVKAGEQVIGMFVYRNKNRVYVETQHEGKTVWGFIPADAVQNVPDTLLKLEGDTCTVAEGVTAIGEMYDYVPYGTADEGGSEGYRNVMVIQPREIQLKSLDLYSPDTQNIKYLKLPESLRRIGMEGICFGSLEEIRFGGNIREAGEAFYSMRIHRIVLGKDYTGNIPGGEYLRVENWSVEEGNPLYRDIDGVLFSADGKTLLKYPSGRKDEHYDVPAGTEEIAARAFNDDMMGIPLKSISLPIGLRKIGEYAFADCGNLLSMAVPLTVKELAPNAFAHCVSLERLSLPNGLSARLDDWVKHEDFTDAFHGDNWATYPKPKEKEEWELESGETFRSYQVLLDNEEGRGTVTVYAASTGSETKDPERVGGPAEYVYEIRNGRGTLGEDRWFDLKNFRNDAGDIFFSIVNAAPKDPAKWTDNGKRNITYYMIWNRKAVFSVMENGTYLEDISLEMAEVNLFREKKDDGQLYGIVVPEDDSAALMDTPGGTKINHLYMETQAKVLEENGNWMKIETAYGTGWVIRSELKIVEEET